MMTNSTNAVSDLEYDLLAVLKNKAEAVRVYDTYIQDAQQAGSQPCSQLLEKLRQEDMKHAEEVRQHLQEILHNDYLFIIELVAGFE
jgi:rubrerythrin